MENVYYDLENKNIDVNILIKVFKSDNLEKVITFIKHISNNEKQYETLFILYLKEYLKRNKDNKILEKILINKTLLKYDEIVSFILSNNLDLEYKDQDYLGIICRLKDVLSTHIKNPDIMKKYLNKLDINDEEYFWFGEEYYNSCNDLCRMNIIAGNYREAYGYFLWDEYKLFLVDKMIKQGDCYFVEEFDGSKDDVLFQILKELSNKKEDYNNENYKRLLRGILYSDKVKIFYRKNLELLEKINEEEYMKFLVYLCGKVINNEIMVYNFKEYDCRYIYDINMDMVLKEASNKVLRKVKNEE